jgi:predicted ATPase
MIDWSWEPLPEPEWMVLRRLAVHAGGATLDSAEGVGDGVERGSVLDLVTGLVDRSLLALIDGGRYRMLESVAVYARERLDEAGETASAVARHSRYFIELAEHADGRLRGPEQQAWLARWTRIRRTSPLRCGARWTPRRPRLRCGWSRLWAGTGTSVAGTPRPSGC